MPSLDDIRFWLEEGKQLGATHVMVVRATSPDWEHEDYPVYVMPDEDFYERYVRYGLFEPSIQKILEVYDLSMDFDEQMNETRACHLPASKTTSYNSYTQIGTTQSVDLLGEK